MPSILEILRGRRRQQTAGVANQQGLRTGIVVEVGSPTITVNDGVSTVQCYSMVSERLRIGDRVWIGTGSGVAVILGLAGRDPNFHEP